ncbi:MAG: glycosyltransferase family protein [Bacteroidetes bacterium]|nr:glycosyltransferase family protein [Fibrella sp.]
MLQSPAILVVVQARMTSSRLPGKVLLPLLGEPLLVRMVERLRMAETPFQIVVATSTDPADDILETICRDYRIECFRGDRDDCLDRHYRVAVQYSADIVVKIPSDCPLIDPRIIDQVLGVYLANPDRYDFVSNLHPPTWPDGNDVEIMTLDCLKATWQEATKPLEREHTTPYIWDRPGRFRIGNVVWSTGLDYAMSHRFTIDYPADYKFIEQVFLELYPENAAFSCEDIVDLLERQPEIYRLNADYAGVNWYRHHLNELNTVSADQTKQVAGNP